MLEIAAAVAAAAAGATNLLIKFSRSSSESQGQRYKKWRTRGLEKCSRRTQKIYLSIM